MPLARKIIYLVNYALSYSQNFRANYLLCQRMPFGTNQCMHT